MMYLPDATIYPLGPASTVATHPATMPNISSSNMNWTIADVGSDDKGGARLGNWSSLIGIITSIVGNILIALALNVQRYSHIQLHRRRVEARVRAKEAMKRAQSIHRNGYGTTETSSANAQRNGDDPDDPLETHPLSQSFQSGDSSWSERSSEDYKAASTYLKSPSWWVGQVLMTIGEMGNFLAYGFAPASIVSPLGVVALISNCVIAPIFFGEIFRARDFWGVVIAVAGAVTVVLSAKQEETKLDPHDVWDAITSMEFEVYLGVTIFFIIVLMWASPRYGHRTILIDLGLVGLFGGYTALTTKGVSSMLSSTLFRAFTTPVTYALIIILLGTAVMQVRYVNKALQRFDSTQVIPIQFVLFTLSVIIGSAILYRDFERTTAQQAAKFIGGCLLTFFGVFLITSGRPRQDDDDRLGDDENAEETIGLRDQETSDPYTDTPEQPRLVDQQHPASAESSRRSSRASRVSFIDPIVNPLDKHLAHGSRDSSIRKADASASGVPILTPVESSSLLNNPWTNSADEHTAHPGLPPTWSADSVPTLQSIASLAITEPLQSSISLPPPTAPPLSPERPATPRASISRPHSRHLSNTFISPSPLSSTVSAVVADALLRGENSPTGRRRSIRRIRPSIRSSIFVSHSEDTGTPDLATEPLVRPNIHGEVPPYRDDPELDENKTFRGRARSLSNALGDMFGRKKRRRTSNPEAGISQESQTTDSSEANQPNS